MIILLILGHPQVIEYIQIEAEEYPLIIIVLLGPRCLTHRGLFHHDYQIVQKSRSANHQEKPEAQSREHVI